MTHMPVQLIPTFAPTFNPSLVSWSTSPSPTQSVCKNKKERPLMCNIEPDSQNYDYIFVYGTLRSDYQKLKHPKISLYPPLQVMQNFDSSMGCAYVKGFAMFDLGDYPGVTVADGSNSKIVGEIYRMKRSPDGHELRILDEYEECGPEDEWHLYARKEISAYFVDSDQSLNAWIYIFIRPIVDHPLIFSGDYVSYLKEKLKIVN